ncbi:hypothetical protein J5N97_003515 [Dioscorea zingiberensis]|uniref:ENTH domain-containing protein n=1 Tax=Dioscorea zingiberensis TaxID=325984 RepID=A0A9D5HQG2_9LILI|nr:hypothetical protein J5N97_003515 [Dioscorea zingiberensis]
MGTLPSLRKAYGVLKDSTKVGLVKVNSDFKALDVAIVKATSHVERPPSERQVRKIIAAVKIGQPRADVLYCVHALARRLMKTRNWIVALKTLIVIHRILRDGSHTFKEESISYSGLDPLQRISNFADHSSQLALDCSSWIQVYSLFLRERLECFKTLKYDIETECLRTSQGPTKERVLKREELVEQLPALQLLLSRLVSCLPRGEALGNYLLQYALALVLKESFKIYCVINQGIIDLVDMFFDMPKQDAIRACIIYRKAEELAENLSSFYKFCKGLEVARNFQFPVLRELPQSFLATMEQYVDEAPQAGLFLSTGQLLLTYKQEEASLTDEKEFNFEDRNEPEEAKEASKPATDFSTQPIDMGDLLCFDDEDFVATELEESNDLAITVISQGNSYDSSEHCDVAESEVDPSGWELALVTDANNNTCGSTEDKLVHEMNRLWIDNLYDQASKGQENTGLVGSNRISTNPFETPDPFNPFISNVSPPNAQMAPTSPMFPEQQHEQQDTMMPMVPQTYQSHHPQPQRRSTNPFDDEFFFHSQDNHS